MSTEHHEANIKFLDEEISLATAVRNKYLAEREAGNKSPNMAMLLRYNQHRLDSMKRIRQLFIESSEGGVITAGFHPASFCDGMDKLLTQIRKGELMYESGGALVQEEEGRLSFTSTIVFRINNTQPTEIQA